MQLQWALYAMPPAALLMLTSDHPRKNNVPVKCEVVRPLSGAQKELGDANELFRGLVFTTD
jgi:hypothetical protein